MVALDPVKKKAHLTAAKMALQFATQKDKDGNPRRIHFAFAPGKDKTDHILMIDHKKKGPVLMAEITKLAKDRKALCHGTAIFQKTPKPTLYVTYGKKLSGAERKMIEALVTMKLPLKVRLEGADADDDDADDQTLAAADDDGSELAEVTDDADADADEGEDADAAADDEDETEVAEADEDDETEDEEAEDEETEDAGAEPERVAAAAPAAAKGRPPLGQAPEVWHKTRALMSMNINKLKAAIKAEYKDEAPELIAEIDKNMAQIDRIQQTLDHRLAESLEKAHKAKDEAARQAELKNSKAILTNYLKYVNSEPLIAHIDKNPFGVETNLKKVLTASLTHMAKVVS